MGGERTLEDEVSKLTINLQDISAVWSGSAQFGGGKLVVTDRNGVSHHLHYSNLGDALEEHTRVARIISSAPSDAPAQLTIESTQ